MPLASNKSAFQFIHTNSIIEIIKLFSTIKTSCIPPSKCTIKATQIEASNNQKG